MFNKTMFFISLYWQLFMIDARTAAHYANDSLGLMLLFGSFPFKYSETIWIILGILVDPPTSTTSSMSVLENLESLARCPKAEYIF